MAVERQVVLAWTEEGGDFGLPVACVRKTVRMVAITTLPAAPSGVSGVINYQGRIIPVLSLAARLAQRPAGCPRFEQQLVISQQGERFLALVADHISGLLEVAGDQFTVPPELGPGTSPLAGLLKAADRLLLVPEFGKLFQPEELAGAA